MNDGEKNRRQFKIEDEEGFVDQQIKSAILDLRHKIDERDDQLAAMVANNEINEQQALGVFYRTINQYLRRIEPLLKDEDIEGATQAYKNESLGELEIPPPPVELSTPDRFGGKKEAQLQRMFADADPDIKLAPASEIPLPKTKQVEGLKEIIDYEGKNAEWEIEAQELNGKELLTFGNSGEEITITNSRPYSWSILSNAVRAADTFLHNSGIGMKIGHPEKDDGDDNPF